MLPVRLGTIGIGEGQTKNSRLDVRVLHDRTTVLGNGPKATSEKRSPPNGECPANVPAVRAFARSVVGGLAVSGAESVASGFR